MRFSATAVLVCLLTVSAATPAVAQQVLLAEDFDSGWSTINPPNGWRIVFDGDTAENDWHRAEPGSPRWPDNPTPFCLLDSTPVEPNVDSLITPVINCADYNVVTLRCSTFFAGQGLPYFAKLLGSTDGQNFTEEVFTYYDTTLGPELQVFDLPWAANQPSVQLAWTFTGQSQTFRSWAVDNVTVTGQSSAVDVGVTEILAPRDTVDSAVPVVPSLVVENFSSVEASFPVHLSIGTWHDSLRVESLAGGAAETLQFREWLAAPRGPLVVTGWTSATGDINRANDTLRGETVVRVFDIAAVRIFAPRDTVDSNALIQPQVRVRNTGTDTADFYAWLWIGAWVDSFLVEYLGPAEDRDIFFDTCRIQGSGLITARCSTGWFRDRYPENDTISKRVFIRPPGFRDAAATRIIAPSGSVRESSAVVPRGIVRNNSGDTVTLWELFCIFESDTLVYADSAETTLGPDKADTHSYRPWLAAPQAEFATRLKVRLEGDMNPDNDSVLGSFIVIPAIHDVALTRIVSPPDTVYAGGVVPAAWVRNVGSFAETFRVRFRIWRGPNTVYSESATVTALAPGDSARAGFRTWNAGPGLYNLRCTLDLPGDADPTNDFRNGLVQVETLPVAPGWHEVASVPLEPSGKPVKAGGALTHLAADGRTYGLKGNKTTDFHCYLPVLDTWLPLESMPAGTEGKRPGKGAALTSDGERFIYATKGNNTTGFYRYDCPADSWFQLPDVPLGASGKKVKGGTGLAWVTRGDTGFVYLLKGYKTEFYRFNTLAEAWQALADAPPGAKPKWDKGSWLVYDEPGARLFAHKAKYHEFYAYDPAAGTWGPLFRGMPLVGVLGKNKKSKDGGSAAYDNGSIWALKGGNTQEFWRYFTAEDSWTELDTIPALGSTGKKKKVKAGAALAAAGNSVFYAFKGNKSREFWRYRLPSGPPGVAETPAPDPAPRDRPCATIVRGVLTVSRQLTAGGSRPELLDACGRRVLELRPGPNDISGLAPGVYFVSRLAAHGSRLTAKVVIE